MISNCDSYPFLSPVMAELDPAICSGTSLQMAAKVAGRDECIAINGKWDQTRFCCRSLRARIDLAAVSGQSGEPKMSGQLLESRRRAIGPVRPWSCAAATVEVGRPQGSQHGGSREDVEATEQNANCASREAL